MRFTFLHSHLNAREGGDGGGGGGARVETKLRKIKVGESYFTTVFRYSKRYDTLRNTLMLTREKFTVQCVPK